ncbi:MAG: TIM barrel protein, partial [Caldiserica bacterium]|nr:TIM barrel protein [Caldisericota bacterium]
MLNIGIGGDTKLAVDRLRATGVPHVGIWCDQERKDWVWEVKEAVSAADERGIETVALPPHWGWIIRARQNPEEEVTRLRAIIDLCAELNIGRIHLSLGELPRDAAESEQARQREVYNAVFPYAEDKGILLCTHTTLMPGTYMHGVEGVESFLRQYPYRSNKLLYCVGSAYLGGHDVFADLVRWQDKIAHIHLRNVTGRWEEFEETMLHARAIVNTRGAELVAVSARSEESCRRAKES